MNIIRLYDIAPEGFLRRSELTDPLRRKIRAKEIYLNRRCVKIWKTTNRHGEAFIFGRFVKGRNDHVVVTIADYNPSIGWVPAQ